MQKDYLSFVLAMLFFVLGEMLELIHFIHSFYIYVYLRRVALQIFAIISNFQGALRTENKFFLVLILCSLQGLIIIILIIQIMIIIIIINECLTRIIYQYNVYCYH